MHFRGWEFLNLIYIYWQKKWEERDTNSKCHMFDEQEVKLGFVKVTEVIKYKTLLQVFCLQKTTNLLFLSNIIQVRQYFHR